MSKVKVKYRGISCTEISATVFIESEKDVLSLVKSHVISRRATLIRDDGFSLVINKDGIISTKVYCNIENIILWANGELRAIEGLSPSGELYEPAEVTEDEEEDN